VPGLDKPLGTGVDGQKHALVAAFLAKHFGESESPVCPLDRACSTVTTQDHHHLIAANLVKHFGGEPQPGRTTAPLDTPAPIVLPQGGKQALVTSHLAKVRHEQHRGDR